MKNKTQLVRLTSESTIEDVKRFLYEQIEDNIKHLEHLARTGQRRKQAYTIYEARNGVLIEMMSALNPNYGRELFERL